MSGTFKPTRAGAFAGTIVMQSNDPAHQRVTVEVRGSGVPATTRPAVCSSDPGSDRLDLFVRGADDALWYRWFGGNPWSGPDWRSLGGVLTSEPSAVALAPGLIYSFVRGTDNALWYGWLAGEAFSAGGSLGGVLTSAPAACSTGPDRLDVFVRGTDNAIWYRRFDGQAWSAWDSLGGVAASAPAATAMGGAAWVFVRGTDNALWYRWVRGPGDLSGWQRLEGVLTSGPAVCVPTSDQEALDVFVRGTDNGIWYSRLGAQGWSSWEGLGRGVIADPAATAMGGASWVVVRGTDGALYFRWRNGPGIGSDWQRFPI